MGFDTQDTLRNAGVDPTDDTVLPVLSFGGARTNGATATDTYSPVAFASLLVTIRWGDYFPSTVTTRVLLYGKTVNGGDRIDVRLRNRTDGETIVEAQNVGSNTQFLAANDYRPSTTGSAVEILPQARNGDNSTSVELDNPYAVVGIKL
jgi:hypothetical protein